MAVGRGSCCCRQLSPDAGASVSALAPFPAVAHRTGLADLPHPALGRASQQGMHGVPRTIWPLAIGTSRLPLGPAIQLLPEVLDEWGSSLTAIPRLYLPQERTRTRAPSLHRHYPASSVPWAPPTSTRPEAGHFRPPRLMAANHHRHGSRTLPQRPSAHADPTTPAGESGFFGRLLPRPPTAFPLWQEGRLQRETIEACSGFTCFSACAFAPWLPKDFPRGFSRTIARARLLQWLPGVPTIPRAGLAPAGLRDPGGPP